MVKLATRALVYFHVPTKTPLFFDSDGRNNLFPTVYALWRVRQIVPTTEAGTSAPAGGGEGGAGGGGVCGGGGGVAGGSRAAIGGRGCCCPPLVVHPPVSKFVLNGADVMLPGES